MITYQTVSVAAEKIVIMSAFFSRLSVFTCIPTEIFTNFPYFGRLVSHLWMRLCIEQRTHHVHVVKYREIYKHTRALRFKWKMHEVIFWLFAKLNQFFSQVFSSSKKNLMSQTWWFIVLACASHTYENRLVKSKRKITVEKFLKHKN